MKNSLHYNREIDNEKPAKKQQNKYKKKIWFILSLCVGVVLFAVIINNIRLQDLIAIFRKIELKFLAIFILLSLGVTLLRAWRFFVYIKYNKDLVTLYGAFALLRPINIIFPFRTGDAAFIFLLKKFKLTFNITETIPVWIFLKTTDLLALTIWLVAASVSIPYVKQIRFYKYGLVIMSGLAMMFILTSWWLASRNSASTVGTNWVSQRIYDLKNGFKRLSNIKDFFKVLFLACIIWVILIGSLVALQQAFDTPLGYHKSFFAASLVLTASILPIHAPLLIGTGEAIWIGINSLLGIKLEEAIILAVGIRIFELLIAAIDGLIGCAILYCKKNK
jgi:uncharacterized membrane protein YbhN (UPF0104 family)